MQTPTTTPRSRRLLAAALAAGLLATACGSDADTSTDTSTDSDTGDGSESVTTDAASGESASGKSNTATGSEKDGGTDSASSDSGDATSYGGLLQERTTAQDTLLETADGQTIYGNLNFVLQDADGCPVMGADVCGDFTPLLSPTGDVAADGLDPAEFAVVDNTLGAQLAFTKSLEKGIPLYTYSGEGPGEYAGVEFGFGWYPMGTIGKLINSFDPELE